MVLFIVAFFQRAGELWFKKENMPWGGIGLSCFLQDVIPHFCKDFSPGTRGEFFISLTVSLMIVSSDSFVHQRLTNNSEVLTGLLSLQSSAHHRRYLPILSLLLPAYLLVLLYGKTLRCSPSYRPLPL